MGQFRGPGLGPNRALQKWYLGPTKRGQIHSGSAANRVPDLANLSPKGGPDLSQNGSKYGPKVVNLGSNLDPKPLDLNRETNGFGVSGVRFGVQGFERLAGGYS